VGQVWVSTLRIEEFAALRTAADRDAVIRHVLAQEQKHEFDLSRGPLLRLSLLRLSADDHLLCINMHHIICDGWSFGVLFRELSVLYSGYVAGTEPALPKLERRYADYAGWQRQWLAEQGPAQRAYWRRKLAGLRPLRLPPDNAPGGGRAYGGERLTLKYSGALSKDLESFCREADVTLFMVLLTGLGLVLHERTGEPDVAIGSAIANRTRAEWEPLIGFFVNTLVLRMRIERGVTLSNLLQQVKQSTMEAYANQDVPFEQVVEALNPLRRTDENPLFSIMMVLQPNVEPPVLPGIEVRYAEQRGTAAKFDVLFSFSVASNGLQIIVEYDCDLFQEQTIRDILDALQTVLSCCAAAARDSTVDALLLEKNRQARGSGIIESGYF
jgi:hypothetical protein